MHFKVSFLALGFAFKIEDIEKQETGGSASTGLKSSSKGKLISLFSNQQIDSSAIQSNFTNIFDNIKKNKHQIRKKCGNPRCDMLAKRDVEIMKNLDAKCGETKCEEIEDILKALQNEILILKSTQQKVGKKSLVLQANIF